MKGGDRPRGPGPETPGASLHVLEPDAAKRDKVAEMLRNVEKNFPVEIEVARISAKLAMIKYKAYKTEGFTPEEALQLTMKNILT